MLNDPNARINVLSRMTDMSLFISEGRPEPAFKPRATPPGCDGSVARFARGAMRGRFWMALSSYPLLFQMFSESLRYIPRTQ